MKILNISLDNSILDRNSNAAKRTVSYGKLVDRYTVIVPSVKDENIRLGGPQYGEVEVYGMSGNNRLCTLSIIYHKAKSLIKKDGYDVISVQDPYYLGLVGWFLARKFGIGLEIQVHGWERYSGLRRIVARFVLPRASAVRTVSLRLKRHLVNEVGVREERITTVPIRVSFNSGYTICNTVPKNDGGLLFLTIGRLVPVKNILLQVRAMADIVKEYENAELWIVGSGNKGKKLKSEIKNNKLENNVKLLGWQDDLVGYYRQADTFLLTSNYEGWGMVVIEAAAHGLPIIMTDVGCAGEVIRDGESGLVIPVGDKQALIEAMRRLIGDGNLRQRLGENARRAVSRLPGREESLQLYLSSWEKAVQNNH